MSTKFVQRPPNSTPDRNAASHPMLDIVKRNPRSVATAIGGIVALAASSVWVLRSLARGSKRD